MALFDPLLRDRVLKACEVVERSFELGLPWPTDALLISYDALWKLLHAVWSTAYHSPAENRTMRLAFDSRDKCAIRPHAFKPFDEYIFFYRFQELQRRELATTLKAEPLKRSRYGGDIDHFVRAWQAVALIEMAFMMIRRQRPNETIRWLDLGCGNADITNLVQLETCLPDQNWEIVGVDWNASAIGIASKRAPAQRKFLVGDAKEARRAIGGQEFHIISAFEVIEHLEDPVTTVMDWRSACSDYLIVGSPRLERPWWAPPFNHVWTFDRQGFCDILSTAGFTPTFANEACVGSIPGRGAEWLTVICGKDKVFPRIV